MKKNTSQTDKQKGIEDRQTEFDYSQTRNEDIPLTWYTLR